MTVSPGNPRFTQAHRKDTIAPHLDLHYVVDDYTDPWRTPETILMLHGNAESSASWYAWVPRLAHQYRVVRPDMRGFGASTPMPRDFPWTLDVIIDDFCRLMDTLGVERFHLVGAKIGGTIARAFAARRPRRLRTLTLVGTPTPYRVGVAEHAPTLIKELEQQGVEHWAQQNMANRLGSTFAPEGVAWWTTFMGRTAVSTQLGFMQTGIRLRRDNWVSVRYAEELNSDKSSVTLQRTDRHGILVRQVALKRK